LDATHDLQAPIDLIFGNVPARLWIKDEAGRYVFVNQRLCEAIGIDREKWLGSRDEDLFPNAGHIYWRKDLRVLTSGEPLVTTDQVEKGKFAFIVRYPITIDGRRYVGGMGVETTEQVSVLAEVIRLRDEAFRNERLRALGEMASGIVHDLKNIFNNANLQLRLLRAKAGDSVLSEVDALTRSVASADDRLRGLQDFVNARKQEELRPVDLVKLIPEAIDMVRFLIEKAPTLNGGRIKLECSFAEALPEVNAPPSQLKHVISNLLLNARDAMPDGGTLSVVARRNGRSVEVQVADEGTGIEASALEKVFEPFYTTKRLGNGLGLSMARDVMSRARGSIVAENRQPMGTVFTLTFPVSI
jgi:signal transduction histidine kinase